MATVNLLAISTVLGKGYVLPRLEVLFVMSYLMAIGIGQYLTYVESTYIRTVNNMGTSSYVSYSRNWYQSLVNGLAEARDSWASWLWLNACAVGGAAAVLAGERISVNQNTPLAICAARSQAGTLLARESLSRFYNFAAVELPI